MVRLLPFILIPILVIAGLGYWRYTSSKPSLESPKTATFNDPIEVPKTLPGATIEDRIKALEDSVTSVVNKLNVSLPTPTADSSLEAAVSELKVRISSLENATPAPAVSSSQKAPLYIPLGSGGSGNSRDWVTMPTYEVSIDPAEYTGYSSMKLEVNMRLNEPKATTAYARLFNTTDNSGVTLSEANTSSTSFGIVSSSGFSLAGGKKTYKLQVKTLESGEMFVQDARIKVNF